MSEPIKIDHLPEQGRFQTLIDGLRCEVDYTLQGHVMHITHTGVPSQLEGRGLAGQLVSHALTWARSQGLQVNPVCSYVQVYLRRHPEWRDLLPTPPSA